MTDTLPNSFSETSRRERIAQPYINAPEKIPSMLRQRCSRRPHTSKCAPQDINGLHINHSVHSRVNRYQGFSLTNWSSGYFSDQILNVSLSLRPRARLAGMYLRCSRGTGKHRGSDRRCQCPAPARCRNNTRYGHRTALFNAPPIFHSVARIGFIFSSQGRPRFPRYKYR